MKVCLVPLVHYQVEFHEIYWNSLESLQKLQEIEANNEVNGTMNDDLHKDSLDVLKLTQESSVSGLPGLSQPPPPSDAPVVDTAEQVYISSLALLKMLKHGRAGVPMEVMGLMLGK